MLTVHTWMRWPCSRSRRPRRGLLPQLVDRPVRRSNLVDNMPLGHLPRNGSLDEEHHLQRGRELLHPGERDPGEAHHPRRATSAPAQPNSSSSLDQASLDEAGVARRVLGLDGEVDVPVVVADHLEQPAQGQHLALVALGELGLVVEVGPRVLPRRRVEVVELLQASSSRPRPRAFGGPVHPAVVHADEVAVGGQPDVALERVGTLVERLRRRRRGCARPWSPTSPGARPPAAAPRACAWVHRGSGPGRHR